MKPPLGVNFIAFERKFRIICLIRFGSDVMNTGTFDANSKVKSIDFVFACIDMRL